MSEERSGRVEHRAEIRNYFDLTAWQRARQLVKSIYQISKEFPKEETYGLVSQIRRAAVSVPSNIAEGYGRGTRKDYVHFLHGARGSLYEMQTQLLLAEDLGYLSAQAVKPLMADISDCSRLLGSLIRSLSPDQGEAGV
jgi:four helix bundle protein